jgi:hypothetical protein
MVHHARLRRREPVTGANRLIDHECSRNVHNSLGALALKVTELMCTTTPSGSLALLGAVLDSLARGTIVQLDTPHSPASPIVLVFQLCQLHL